MQPRKFPRGDYELPHNVVELELLHASRGRVECWSSRACRAEASSTRTSFRSTTKEYAGLDRPLVFALTGTTLHVVCRLWQWPGIRRCAPPRPANRSWIHSNIQLRH